jgi:anti-anti-sigma factor
MELSVRLRSVSPVPTVDVGGELDLESGRCLADVLDCMMRARGSVLDLDLTGVTFIDCAGVGALLASRRVAQLAGGRLRVIAVSPCVRRIMKITGLQQVLENRLPAAGDGGEGGRRRHHDFPGGRHQYVR